MKISPAQPLTYVYANCIRADTQREQPQKDLDSGYCDLDKSRVMFSLSAGKGKAESLSELAAKRLVDTQTLRMIGWKHDQLP